MVYTYLNCKNLIGMHEMHGQIHPYQDLATISFAHDPLSSVAYHHFKFGILYPAIFLYKMVAGQWPISVCNTVCTLYKKL